MSLKLDFNIKQMKKFSLSYFCLGHFLILFSFRLLQLNVFLPSVIFSLISF